MRKFLATILTLAIPLPVLAAPQMPTTEIIGSYYKTPEQKAMEHYSRGLKAKRKAEAETDPEKQAKLYKKAKEELSKSVGYAPNYDGYLALGQVYLALSQRESAQNACSLAQSLKPKDEAAMSCLELATRPAPSTETLASEQQ